MAGYRKLVENGLRERGHLVKSITAPRWLSRLAPPRSGAEKWLGYLDQLVIFPALLLLQQVFWPAGTQIIVLDQALGPWVPWIQHRKPLIICHDLLALHASRGDFTQQHIGATGYVYQQLIRWGFRHGQRFAAVSAASAADLRRELKSKESQIRVLYNPLPEGFWPEPEQEARERLKETDRTLATTEYILHVGGYWYKNREGVCAVFAALQQARPQLQLVLVGHLEEPACSVLNAHPEIRSKVLHLPGVDLHTLRALYSAAAALLFPSWLEGFGWPILEALACGCPVITTDRRPMREVGGEAAVYVPACPGAEAERQDWIRTTAETTLRVLERSSDSRQHWRNLGLAQAATFSRQRWLDQLEQALGETA